MNRQSRQAKKIQKVTDLLAVLSRPGALAILRHAEKTIKADRHLQTGLTRRQYHARMSQLVSVGLIEKVGNTYRQTALGAIVYRKYLPRLEEAFMESSDD